ncbi:MAG: 2Fe-2S iron-sulfur cluster-binding protein [Polyangiaceae bacterium]
MPKVEFQGVGMAREKHVDAPDGGELVDLCDQVLAPIPFSCRSASCGTCQVEVLVGMECFEEPNDEERELLEILDGPENSRLACQARVKPGPGLIRLKPIGT